MFWPNHSGRPPVHLAKPAASSGATVERRPTASGADRCAHEEVLTIQRHRPCVLGMQPVDDETPRRPRVQGLGQPEGRRRDDVIASARVGEHLVDVGVDVDRRLPRPMRIMRAQDPSDVHVREESAVGPGRERTCVGRPSPRRVPTLSALSRVERREHLRGACSCRRQPRLRGPDQDAAVDREEAPPELLVDRRDRLDRATVEIERRRGRPRAPTTLASRAPAR